MKSLKGCLFGITSLVLMLSTFAPSADAQVVVKVGDNHHHYHRHYYHHHYHHYYR